MILIKKVSVVILTIVFLTILVACKQAEPPVFDDDKTMQIGAWVSPSTEKDEFGNYKYITLEQYQRIKDAGINVIYALYEHIDMNATMLALDLAEQVGIEYYVRDGRIAGLFQDIFDNQGNVIQSEYEADLDIFLNAIDDYSDHPAFKGNLIYDEPSADLYPWLGFYNEVYQEYLPDKDFYVNLFPTYAGLSARGDRDYDDYIQEYIDIVKPKFVSYDHYPFMLFYDKSVITDDYLLNMEIISQKSHDANLPFMLFLQSVGYTNVTGTQRRDITENDLRFQIGVSMAYGTQGIQHFTYWTPTDGSIESFGDAFITRDGEMTDTYHAGKIVNKEVLDFDHVYLDFEWQGVMTYAKDPDFPNVNFRMINSETEHDAIDSISATEDLLIGYFENEDELDAFMIVNYTDPSVNLSNEIEIDFEDATYAMIYIDGHEEIIKLNRGKLNITLDSGSYAFVIPYA